MKNLHIYLITIVLAVLMLTITDAHTQDQRIRAKIGIQIRSSGGDVFSARKREMVNPGDRIRIYVNPLETAYVYVIYSDGKTAGLLNMTMQKISESVLYLPSDRAFYKVDGTSPGEKFTIICSPEKLPHISGINQEGMPHEKWMAFEAELLKKSKIKLTRKQEPRIEIGGNVRGSDNLENRELFVKNLPTFSGKGLLVKKYEFKVKK